MKDVVQKICREKYGFTPIKGDISIGAEKTDEGGNKYREVKVGQLILKIMFTIDGIALD